jgi:excisionase family DNA binding protein
LEEKVVKLLSIMQTADKLNLKVSTLYMWVHKKKIPYVKIGGKLGFIEDQIDNFIIKNNYVSHND